MNCHTVLILSSHSEMRTSLAELVTQTGLSAYTADSLETWLEAAGSVPASCVVLDTVAGDLTGPAQLTRFAALCKETQVLVLTEAGDVPTAVQAIRQGAVDVAQNPIELDKILERIQRIVSQVEDESV